MITGTIIVIIIILIAIIVIIAIIIVTLFATRMTGTSSDALTFAIRFLYSTASLKLCLESIYCETANRRQHDQHHNNHHHHQDHHHQPVSDAVADDEPLSAAHVLLPHRREFNLCFKTCQ